MQPTEAPALRQRKCVLRGADTEVPGCNGLIAILLTLAIVLPAACGEGSHRAPALDSSGIADGMDGSGSSETISLPELPDFSETADTVRNPDLGGDPLRCAGAECEAPICSGGEVWFEDLGACSAPVATCSGGWCLVPAAALTIGGTGDVHWGFWPPFPRHRVRLTRSVWFQQTEVTQAMWLERSPGENPSWFVHCGKDCPVESVTVAGAIRYAISLSERDGLAPCYQVEGCDDTVAVAASECSLITFAGPDCLGYRLPSEAEWEHAARAGSVTCLPTGDLEDPSGACETSKLMAEQGWFCGNSAVGYEGCDDCSNNWRPGVPAHAASCCGPHPVGGKVANGFGLHDMYGNVTELTGTVFAEYVAGSVVDPGFDARLELNAKVGEGKGQAPTR